MIIIWVFFTFTFSFLSFWGRTTFAELELLSRAFLQERTAGVLFTRASHVVKPGQTKAGAAGGVKKWLPCSLKHLLPYLPPLPSQSTYLPTQVPTVWALLHLFAITSTRTWSSSSSLFLFFLFFLVALWREGSRVRETDKEAVIGTRGSRFR